MPLTSLSGDGGSEWTLGNCTNKKRKDLAASSVSIFGDGSSGTETGRVSEVYKERGKNQERSLWVSLKEQRGAVLSLVDPHFCQVPAVGMTRAGGRGDKTRVQGVHKIETTLRSPF